MNWQKESSKDPYHNMTKLRNLKVGNGTLTELLSNISKYGKRLKQDILANRNVEKHVDAVDPRITNLVEIGDVVEYFCVGILYDNCPEEYRKAFKESEIDPTAGLITTLSSVKSLAARRQVRIENEAM